jgi:hypothetical protein
MYILVLKPCIVTRFTLQMLHGGGRAQCPWGHLGDKRARKEAAKALRKLSEGLGPVPNKKGKGKKA